MISRSEIRKKLNGYGFKWAELNLSKKISFFSNPEKLICDFDKKESVISHHKMIDTYSIEMLSEEDIDHILKALHYYSKSTNPQVDELRNEYFVMRKMLEIGTR